MQRRIDEAMRNGKVWSGYFVLLLGFLLFFAVVRSALFGSFEPEKHIWVEISLLLLIALVAERLVQQWKQPFVMVLLLLGVAISPYTFEALWPQAVGLVAPLLAPHGIALDSHNVPMLVSESELIAAFANLGVIVLLFRIGLHAKLEQVFNLKNLAVALGGIILPFLAGYLYATSTGGNFAFSLFVGAALTATSVGITVAVLEEMKLLNKPFAQMILGAAVIDDILALMVLSLIKNIPSTFSLGALTPLFSLLAIAAIFVISGIALGRLFVNLFFNYGEREISKRTLSGMLAVLFFYCFAAESLGLSAIVGAFIAGIVLGFSPTGIQLNRALFPLDVLFTPIFFISLGMLVNVWEIPALAIPVLALTIIAVITKVVGCGIPALLARLPIRDAVLVGWGMVPRGEIALIIALLGVSTLDTAGNPILTASEYTLLASMAFLTTVIVPVGLKWLAEWSARAR